ncbi:MAG: stimulus-sensing domain-containing protein [Pseudomonadota bacterium]
MAVRDPGLETPHGLRSRVGAPLRTLARSAAHVGLRGGRRAARGLGAAFDAGSKSARSLAGRLAQMPYVSPIVSALQHVGNLLLRAHVAWTSRVARSSIWRAATNTIWKRILVSNLIGLGVVVIGLLLVSFDSRWVINTRSEALRVQGQIIAAAIAGDLKVSSRHSIIDPDRPAVDAIARIPFRDDGFASLELSIRPERVAPILRRLIEPTATRARVVASDYDVIVDSATILKFDPGSDDETGDLAADDQRPRWKDFWTRALHLLIGKEVQVYRASDMQTAANYPEVLQAMRGTPQTLLFLNQQGEQIVNVAVPIKRQDTVLGVLLMSTLPGEVDDILGEASKGFWNLLLVAFAAAVASAFMLARTVAEPMRRLSAAAERVSKDINTRTELQRTADGGSEEVAQMSRALQTMVNALYRRIESSEKFAADVAHELKNPLAAASSTAQCLSYARTDEDRAELVKQIELELKRLNKLITDVSKASRLDAELARQSNDPVQLEDVLDGVIDIFRDKPAAEHCQVVLRVAEEGNPRLHMVSGNGGRLAQVITNLVDNAVSFTPPDGTVAITLSRAGDHVEVRVDDQGPGIEDDKLDTIFTRFYTYRPTAESSRGNNSGLGLSISREIIVAHGGEVWAENRFDDAGTGGSDGDQPIGARFVVRLPARIKG